MSWGSTTPYVMLSTVAGLYRCPNVRFDTTIAYTNNPYSGSMRGYGNLESTFAVESQMDELAERLGLDRLEMRRRNAVRPATSTPRASSITSCAMAECLDAVAAETPAGRRRRRGRAGGAASATRRCSTSAAAPGSTAPTAAAPSSSSTTSAGSRFITGATEIGQGSETVLAMIVAETLGVPLDRVEVVNSDTAVKPWDVGAHASRTTFIAGNAARLAAEKIRGPAPGHGGGGAGRAAPSGWPSRTAGSSWPTSRGRRLPYDRVGRAGHYRAGGQTLVAEAFYDPPTEMLDKDLRGNVSATYGFAAQAVLSTSTRPPGASRCAGSPRPTTSAARSIRWRPRARSTAASTWGSATR